MAKNKSTTNNDDSYSSDDSVEIYEQSTPSEEATFKQSESKEGYVTLVFKKNRKKDLHVNRVIYEFWGPSSLDVPKEVIEHEDFKNQAKYFTIKEAK